MLYASGPDLVQTYNAAYAALLGPGHSALGEGKPLPAYLREALSEPGGPTKTVRLDERTSLTMVVTRPAEGGVLMTFVEKGLRLGDVPIEARPRRGDESENYFRNLADSAPAMLWTTDAAGQCTYLSQRWLQYTGRPLEKDLGLGWVENVHPDDREKAGASFLQANAARSFFNIEYRLRRSDGAYRWALDQGTPHFDENGEFLGFVGSVVDVHDLRQAEKSIEEMQLRFNRSARATDLGVWYCDLPFGELDWNTEVKNHFWLPPDARVTIDIFYERIHPEDRARTRASIDQSIAARGPYDIEYRTVHPQDETRVKWIRAIGWTDYSADGTPIRFDGITLDITETKKAREELLRSNTELARFAFVASHDLKEPLRVVANYVQLLRKIYGNTLDETADEFIAHIVNGVNRMYELINDLLSYSRLGASTTQLKPVDVTQVAQLAVENLAPAIRESGATVEIDPLPTVMADAVQYLQLLQNLIGNSLKYRGTEPPHVKVFARRRDDEWVISVRDNGIGIAPEYFEKIFVLFQRLHSKDEYSGTGIGLAVCKKIVERHEGKIWVESAPGAGATFSFTAREVC